MRALLAVLVVLALPAGAHAIVGGQPATQPYPHMAQLRVDGDFLCGASLVRASWVLTAAHCVVDDEGAPLAAGRFTVVLGRQRLSAPGGIEHAVAEVRPHPDYAGNGYDLALLRLEQRSGLAPIAIAGPEQRSTWAPGVAATVTGWGATNSGGEASDELREVQVTIRTDDECASSSASLLGYEPATQLCAGEPAGGRDSCQGDSGGPLTVPAGAATVLAGVVSSGVGCALPFSYGIYARVGEGPLAQWLADNLPGADPAVTPPAGTAPAVVVTRRLRVRDGRLVLRLRSTVRLTSVRVRVTRRGRLVARGRTPSLSAPRTLRLEPRRRVRRGRHVVTVTGRDADGTRLRLAANARR